jgi:glycosyltransferase involved in cell wall biosynthesis
MDVHRTGSRYTFSVAAPRYFRRHLADTPFDVVVEDLNKVPLFTPYWVDAPVALIVHHLFGATAFEEASWPVALATWLLELTVPRVFRSAPVVAVSNSTREDLIERGLDAGRIEVIPNGIVVDHYVPGVPDERFPDPTILFLGRVKKYKRVDLILHALKRITDGGTHARLLIGGRGDHAADLQKLAGDLGLSAQVEFTGFLSEEKKLELFRRTWVHTITSSKEGWGIANMEAAASATPTVASDSPGLRESVIHGETGFLVPHGDVEALAREIQRLLTDDGLRLSMGLSARTFAERFSWDESASAIEAFLGRVVAQQAGQ